MPQNMLNKVNEKQMGQVNGNLIKSSFSKNRIFFLKEEELKFNPQNFGKKKVKS